MTAADSPDSSPAMPHPKCEVCGKDADFQFLDQKEEPAAPRWRLFCGEHGLDYLGIPPKLSSPET